VIWCKVVYRTGAHIFPKNVVATLKFSVPKGRHEAGSILRLHKYKMPWYKFISGPSSYDRLDIRTTWVTTKILVLIYDQILSYDPNAGKGHLSYDPHGVHKFQSEPRYACLWT
jgi:hypothetical protein